MLTQTAKLKRVVERMDEIHDAYYPPNGRSYELQYSSFTGRWYFVHHETTSVSHNVTVMKEFDDISDAQTFVINRLLNLYEHYLSQAINK